jgi:hypothetical protein
MDASPFGDCDRQDVIAVENRLDDLFLARPE